jgi:hypothetical protein
MRFFWQDIESARVGIPARRLWISRQYHWLTFLLNWDNLKQSLLNIAPASLLWLNHKL